MRVMTSYKLTLKLPRKIIELCPPYESLPTTPLQVTVTKSANILREAVLKHIEEATSLPWPPTVESLNSIESQYPELLDAFMKMLLSP